MNKKILLGLVAVGMVASLTACGKETVDVSADADVLFTGYEGYGTATVSKGSWVRDIETKFGTDMSLLELGMLEDKLSDAVEYTLSLTENLSNGDEVTLTIEVDNDALEDYDFKLSGGTKTYTVSGLDEIEPFDPFENLAISFGGMAPNGYASIDTSDMKETGVSLNYTLDKNKGLSNGDEVTVTISTNSGTDVEEYCLSKGKIPTVTEKTFTVSDLASYAMKLEDIPEDTYTKMLSQAEDGIRSSASSWAEGNSIKNIESIGYYFLAPKEGFSVSTNNEIYCVFKVTADITGFENAEEAKADDAKKKKREDYYYTYYRYSDIVILPDGTCSLDLSSGSQPYNTTKSKYGNYSWGSMSYYTFYGYGDLDSMFNDCVTSKISNYTYENTVQ